MRRAAWLAFAVAAGCATPYVYRPQEQATAQVAGKTAASYPIPPEQPKGEVKVATLGLAKLPTAQGEVRAIHVRMVLENDSDGQWQFNPRQPIAAFPDGRRISPMATRDAALVTLAAGEKREIDLFYPLPLEFNKSSKVPEFDVLWSVQTPARLVAERTPVARIEIRRSSAY